MSVYTVDSAMPALSLIETQPLKKLFDLMLTYHLFIKSA